MNSIKTKLYIISICSIAVASVVAIISMYVGNSLLNEEMLKQNIEASAHSVESKVAEMKRISAAMARVIAIEDEVVNAVSSGDREKVIEAVSEAFAVHNVGVEYATVTDAKGVVIARSFNDVYGDSITNQSNVAEALRGKSASFTEVGTEIKLAVRSGYPIRDADGTIIGVISAGYRLDSEEFVDNLKTLTGSDITIFVGDTRVATTIIQNGTRNIGTKLDSYISNMVLNQKQSYFSRAKIGNQPYYTYYQPIFVDGNVVGISFVGLSLERISEVTVRTMSIAIAFVVAACLLMLLISNYFIKKFIVTPVKQMSEAALKLAEGDLSGEDVSYRSRDEIGQLSDSVNRLSRTFKDVVLDLAHMADEHHLGDIEVFIDDSKYSGAYRELTASVNLMVSEHLTLLRTSIACVNEMIDGNFEANIAELPGKKAFINEAINNLQVKLGGIGNEVDGMIKNAVAGKLDARIDISKYRGDWIRLMSGLNDVLAATSEPIKETLEVVKAMSEGNFDVLMHGVYKGDFNVMERSINSTISNISGYIKEITAVMDEFANGNLTISISRDYIGEFAAIKQSINSIVIRMNKLLSEISMSSGQVLAGARQVSETSMTLAQGASEQAAAVEELTATIATVNEKTQNNAENAKKADELSKSTRENAATGTDEMQQMLIAMEGIREASNNISSIIKVIDDIAFQTNLLSLNAAVEAARAGEHGKGFIVVVDEVRSLAAKSKDAAKETTELIGDSIDRVNRGMKIARETSQTLNDIVTEISEVSDIITGISSASADQAISISQINEGINQIANVVQTNSATSEESASASQQLSSQSELLKGMIQVFRLQ